MIIVLRGLSTFSSLSCRFLNLQPVDKRPAEVGASMAAPGRWHGPSSANAMRSREPLRTGDASDGGHPRAPLGRSVVALTEQEQHGFFEHELATVKGDSGVQFHMFCEFSRFDETPMKARTAAAGDSQLHHHSFLRSAAFSSFGRLAVFGWTQYLGMAVTPSNKSVGRQKIVHLELAYGYLILVPSESGGREFGVLLRHAHPRSVVQSRPHHLRDIPGGVGARSVVEQPRLGAFTPERAWCASTKRRRT